MKYDDYKAQVPLATSIKPHNLVRILPIGYQTGYGIALTQVEQDKLHRKVTKIEDMRLCRWVRDISRNDTIDLEKAERASQVLTDFINGDNGVPDDLQGALVTPRGH